LLTYTGYDIARALRFLISKLIVPALFPRPVEQTKVVPKYVEVPRIHEVVVTKHIEEIVEEIIEIPKIEIVEEVIDVPVEKVKKLSFSLNLELSFNKELTLSY